MFSFSGREAFFLELFQKEVQMKRLRFLVITAFVVILCGSVASVFAAAIKEPDLDQRIANQQKRIDEASQSGEISRDDAKSLQGGMDKIKQEMVRMKADGQLSKEERDRLNAMLDRNSDLINNTRNAKKAASPTPAAPKGIALPAPAVPKVLTPAPQDPGIQQAIADQRKRINQGIQSRQITLDESRVLEDNLNHIEEEDARFRSDGNFTQAEKNQLLTLIDQNNKMIQNKATNPVKNMRQTIALKDRTQTIQERFARQQKRIDEGIKSKELTQEEAKVLKGNLDYIKNQDARLRADGKLTNEERERLHILLDQNGEMIENKKHNPVKAVK